MEISTQNTSLNLVIRNRQFSDIEQHGMVTDSASQHIHGIGKTNHPFHRITSTFEQNDQSVERESEAEIQDSMPNYEIIRPIPRKPINSNAFGSCGSSDNDASTSQLDMQRTLARNKAVIFF